MEDVSAVLEAKPEDTKLAMEQLERLLFVLHTLVSHKGGAKVTQPESVCQVGEGLRFVRLRLKQGAVQLAASH